MNLRVAPNTNERPAAPGRIQTPPTRCVALRAAQDGAAMARGSETRQQVVPHHAAAARDQDARHVRRSRESQAAGTSIRKRAWIPIYISVVSHPGFVARRNFW